MAPSGLFLSTLAAILVLTAASPLATRQVGFPWEYVTRLNTARVVIDSIKANTASEDCSDPNYMASMDWAGYDGQFAQTLLCEVAAGIDVFPDIDNAEREFNAALSGLLFVSDNGDGIEYCRTHTIDVDSLDNAGLEGEAIRDFLCHRGTDPTNTPTPLSVSMPSTPTNITITRNSTQLVSLVTIPQTSSSIQQSSSSVSASATAPSPVETSSQSDSSAFNSLRLGSTSSFSSQSDNSLRFGSTSSISPTASTGSAGSAGSAVSSSTQLPSEPAASPLMSSGSTPTTSTDENVTVVVITTFTTVTVTPMPSPTPSSASDGTANDRPILPPLRFTLESRVIPEQVVTESTSLEPTWTIGPPLSFPDPHLASGTMTSTRVA